MSNQKLSAKAGQLQVIRANVIGNLALLRTSGGQMEGDPFTDAILVQHFAFGWQVIGGVTHPCDLTRRGIDRTTLLSLIDSMNLTNDVGKDCDISTMHPDIGNAQDVSAIRALMSFGAVPQVVILKDYAAAEWYGPGGGQGFFKRGPSSWHHIAGSGGAVSASELIKAGVPKAEACPLLALLDESTGCNP